MSIFGPDAKDFIQRMSTNDISHLTRENPAQTSFVTNKGRMVDHCLVFYPSDRHVALISNHQDSSVLMDWLKRFHFIEDLSMEDATHRYHPCFHLTNTKTAHTQIKPDAVRLGQIHLRDQTYDLWASLSDDQGDEVEAVEDDLWQTLRIAAIIPAVPNEICERFMPQNINLESHISDDKGCYLGQEVIRKAQTYQKNAKYLVGLSLSVEDHRSIKARQLAVKDPKGKIGHITSVAPLYLEGAVNALVMVGNSLPIIKAGEFLNHAVEFDGLRS